MSSSPAPARAPSDLSAMTAPDPVALWHNLAQAAQYWQAALLEGSVWPRGSKNGPKKSGIRVGSDRIFRISSGMVQNGPKRPPDYYLGVRGSVIWGCLGFPPGFFAGRSREKSCCPALKPQLCLAIVQFWVGGVPMPESATSCGL